MAEESAPAVSELEKLLRRLEEARAGLMGALEGCDPEKFAIEIDSVSIKRALERAVDDINFYYGRLVARAVNLPQPPCTQTADLMSLREAVMSLQVGHRRFSTLLHDLTQADLEREAVDAEHGTYTLRQILEMAAAHYKLRAQQVQQIAARVG